MKKPGYNSSIEDKIRWLEWFQSIRERIQSNTGKREINDLETLSKYCNINVLKTNNSSLERVKTRNRKISHLSTEAKRLRRNELQKERYAKKQEERIANGEVIVRGRPKKQTKEEAKEKHRQLCRERYYRLKGEEAKPKREKQTREEYLERKREYMRNKRKSTENI